jgi:hypothetical protein
VIDKDPNSERAPHLDCIVVLPALTDIVVALGAALAAHEGLFVVVPDMVVGHSSLTVEDFVVAVEKTPAESLTDASDFGSIHLVDPDSLGALDSLKALGPLGVLGDLKVLGRLA